MSIAHDDGVATQQIHAPRTQEQLVAGATIAHEVGCGTRSARGHGYEMRGMSHVPVSRLHEGRFGRMFRLPPFVPSDERIAEIAATIPENAAGPSPELDNPEIPPGYAYLGRFIDHDLTFDPASSLEQQNDPDALTNFRSTRFNLDCVYGWTLWPGCRRCAGTAKRSSRPPSASCAGTTSGSWCTTSCAGRWARRCSRRCSLRPFADPRALPAQHAGGSAADVPRHPGGGAAARTLRRLPHPAAVLDHRVGAVLRGGGRRRGRAAALTAHRHAPGRPAQGAAARSAATAPR